MFAFLNKDQPLYFQNSISGQSPNMLHAVCSGSCAYTSPKIHQRTSYQSPGSSNNARRWSDPIVFKFPPLLHHRPVLVHTCLCIFEACHVTKDGSKVLRPLGVYLLQDVVWQRKSAKSQISSVEMLRSVGRSSASVSAFTNASRGTRWTLCLKRPKEVDLVGAGCVEMRRKIYHRI